VFQVSSAADAALLAELRALVLAREPYLLHAAVAGGCTELMRFLTRAGTSPTARPRNGGCTPLHVAAARAGSAHLIEQLCAAGVELGIRDPVCPSLLMAAAIGGLAENIDALLNAGADVEHQDWSGHTALYHAVSSESAAAVNALLSRGAKRLPQELAAELEWKLIRAANAGQLGTVSALRSAGVELVTGHSAELLHAARSASLGVVQAWLAAGATLNDDDQGRGREHLQECIRPAWAGPGFLPYVDGAKRLLAAGVRCNDQQRSMLLHAVVPHPALVRALVAAGADCSAKDSAGRTPTLLAAAGGHRDSLLAMLAAGAAAGMGDAERAALVGAALKAGMRGEFLVELLPTKGLSSEHLRLWAAAARELGALLWVLPVLMALRRSDLPCGVRDRIVVLGMLL
jgi:ankyrin repeat protein